MPTDLADRAADLLTAFEGWCDLVPPLTRPLACLADACPVVLDAAQYERAAKLGLAGRVGALQFDSVVFDGGRFEPAQHREDQRFAEVAFLVPAINAEGEVFDVAAWVPETGKVASLLGEIGAMGVFDLDAARLAPPLVHESLRDWLLADELGLFIVDPKIAADELDDVTLAAVDRDSALHLHSRLAPHVKRTPQIVVPRSDARRAG